MAPLRFLFDECVSQSLADIARVLGHDVMLVGDTAPATSDEAIFSLAEREGRVLVSEDKGFGQVAVRSGAASKGLVLLRLPKWNLALKQQRFRHLLTNHASELSGALAVVRPSGVRIRKLGDVRKTK